MSAQLTLTTINLGTDDVARLARFYRDLLGWSIRPDQDDTGAMLRNPAGGVGLSVQYEEFHRAAVWPGVAGSQQMMMHLEILVDDLSSGLQHALECGARLADFQPQDDVRVCIDPAGHPFCLWIED